jgi:hypothetical protein
VTSEGPSSEPRVRSARPTPPLPELATRFGLRTSNCARLAAVSTGDGVLDLVFVDALGCAVLGRHDRRYRLATSHRRRIRRLVGGVTGDRDSDVVLVHDFGELRLLASVGRGNWNERVGAIPQTASPRVAMLCGHDGYTDPELAVRARHPHSPERREKSVILANPTRHSSPTTSRGSERRGRSGFSSSLGTPRSHASEFRSSVSQRRHFRSRRSERFASIPRLGSCCRRSSFRRVTSRCRSRCRWTLRCMASR